MQSRNGRLAVVIGFIVVAIAAFVLLKPGDDEKKTATTAATPAASASAEASATEEATATAEATPAGTAIEVKGGEVVGGVTEIAVSKGDQVEFSVVADVADEVHVHGYDIKKDLKPGEPATFSFKADIDGIFEIELEDAKLQLASLKVEP